MALAHNVKGHLGLIHLAVQHDLEAARVKEPG